MQKNYVKITYYNETTTNALWVRFYDASNCMQYAFGYSLEDAARMYAQIEEFTRDGVIHATR